MLCQTFEHTRSVWRHPRRMVWRLFLYAISFSCEWKTKFAVASGFVVLRWVPLLLRAVMSGTAWFARCSKLVLGLVELKTRNVFLTIWTLQRTPPPPPRTPRICLHAHVYGVCGRSHRALLFPYHSICCRAPRSFRIVPYCLRISAVPVSVLRIFYRVQIA